MKIISEKLKGNTSRDVYLSTIRIESDDHTKNTKVLVCASFEFFWHLLKTNKFTEEQLQQWLDGFIEKELLSKGDAIFNNTVYYYPYATNHDGELSILNFLKNEVDL